MHSNRPSHHPFPTASLFAWVLLLVVATSIAGCHYYQPGSHVYQSSVKEGVVIHQTAGDQPASKHAATDQSASDQSAADQNATATGSDTAAGTNSVARHDSQDQATATQPVSTTKRSPLPQEGEVIDKPIQPTVLAIPADLTATAPAPAKGEVVHWSKAKEHIGHDITVEGKIVQANNIGSICFLNFTNEPRGGDKFYMVVFKDKFDLFGGKPEVYFKNKTVRVTGKVEEHQGRPQMKIRKVEQVQIVE